MTEKLNPIQHLARARDIGKVMIASLIEKAAPNPPEVDYPRFYDYEAEAPAATEEELDA